MTEVKECPARMDPPSLRGKDVSSKISGYGTLSTVYSLIKYYLGNMRMCCAFGLGLVMCPDEKERMDYYS